MYKHIVLFKFKSEYKSKLKEAAEILLSMKGKVPTAKNIEVNIDELKSPRSYDLMLEVTLSSYEDLAVYQNDPYHVDVVKAFMHTVQEGSVSIDYTVL